MKQSQHITKVDPTTQTPPESADAYPDLGSAPRSGPQRKDHDAISLLRSGVVPEYLPDESHLKLLAAVSAHEFIEANSAAHASISQFLTAIGRKHIDLYISLVDGGAVQQSGEALHSKALASKDYIEAARIGVIFGLPSAHLKNAARECAQHICALLADGDQASVSAAIETLNGFSELKRELNPFPTHRHLAPLHKHPVVVQQLRAECRKRLEHGEQLEAREIASRFGVREFDFDRFVNPNRFEVINQAIGDTLRKMSADPFAKLRSFRWS